MAATSVTIKDFREVNGQISSDKLKYSLAKISSVNKHKKDISWQIYVQLVKDSNPDVPIHIKSRYLDNKPMPADVWAVIKVDSGHVEGKIRDTVPTVIKEGKNIGKKSETNVFCQAIRDMIGLHNKKLKKVVDVLKEDTRVTRYLPMLAHVYQDYKSHVNWKEGVYVQIKFNGIRLLAVMDGDEVLMYSRSGTVYPGFSKIKENLKPLFKNLPENSYLDGEMYAHNIMLQDISGLARKKIEGEDNPDIVYMLYDTFVPQNNLGYAARYDLLANAYKKTLPDRIQLVTSYIVYSEEKMKELYDKFIQDKQEGAIIRQNLPYEHSVNNYRSMSLMKVKPTYDMEATCIDWTTGKKGKAAKSIMFICEIPAGIFNVTPKMKIKEREELAVKMDTITSSGKTFFEENYKGKPLIIEFKEYSKKGMPQQATTTGEIRNYE